MRTFIFVFLCLFAICVAGHRNPTIQQPSNPEPRSEPNWMARHEQFNTNTVNNPDIPIIFYGDSITEGWSGNGRSVFDQYYEPLGVANYGISGDRTQHVIWRILNGEVRGLNPKLVVLKIGTNNIGNTYGTELHIFPKDPDQAISKGIIKVVETLRQQLPNTKILLLGVLPRTGTTYFDSIIEINEKIRNLHDGKNIFFLDMFDKFRGDAWGVVPSTLFFDGLHLTTAGYQLWADTMNPLFYQLIQE